MELLQNGFLLPAILAHRGTDHIHCLQVDHQLLQVVLRMQMVIWVLLWHHHHSVMVLCSMDKCLNLHNRRVFHFHHQCREIGHLHHGQINLSNRVEFLNLEVCLRSSSGHHQDHLHPICHLHHRKVSLLGLLPLWEWDLHLVGQEDHHRHLREVYGRHPHLLKCQCSLKVCLHHLHEQGCHLHHRGLLLLVQVYQVTLGQLRHLHLHLMLLLHNPHLLLLLHNLHPHLMLLVHVRHLHQVHLVLLLFLHLLRL